MSDENEVFDPKDKKPVWRALYGQPVRGLDSYSNHSAMNFKLELLGGHGSETPAVLLSYLDEGHLSYPLTHGSPDAEPSEPLAGLLRIVREVVAKLPKSPHGWGTPCKCGSSCSPKT